MALEYMGRKEIKISDDVEKAFELMLLDQKSQSRYHLVNIIGDTKVQKEARKTLGKLFSDISCIFKNTFLFDIRNYDDDDIKFDILDPRAPIPSLLKKWVDECKHDILGIPFSTKHYDTYHANIIIINKKLKTLEHFEPHGSIDASSEKKQIFKEKVEYFFHECCFPDFEYIEPENICPFVGDFQIRKGVQTIQGYEKVNRRTVTRQIRGSCAWWSMWYLNVRIAHPELSPKQAYEKALTTMTKMTNIDYKSEEMENSLETYIIAFVKNILSLANFTLTNDGEEYYLIKNSQGEELFQNKKDVTSSDELIEKVYYKYTISMNDKQELKTLVSRISPAELMTNSDKILNPKTGRYVLRNGAIGRKLLKQGN